MSFLLDPWVDRTLSSSDMNMLHGDSQLIIVAGRFIRRFPIHFTLVRGIDR